MQPDQGNARQNNQPQPQQRRHPEQASEEPGMEGVGGGDGRRVRVLYFLSRDGKVEQPHLIRVLRRRGRRGDSVLRLRDVKRWLSELRGAGMPDAFAWACKRRYKRGYVWEDLADDDVITPVSGGEYVLMGSLITHPGAGAGPAAPSAGTDPTPSSSSSPAAFPSSAALCTALESSPPPADPLPKDPFAPEPPADPKSPRAHEMIPADNPDRDGAASPTPPPRVDDDEDEEEEEEVVVGEGSTQSASRLGASTAFLVGPDHRAGAAGGPPRRRIVEEAEPGSVGVEKQGSHERSNSGGSEGGRGGRRSQVFRSLLRCGADAVQTQDSAVLPFNPHRPKEAGGSNGNSRGCGGGVGVPSEERHQPGEPRQERQARRSRGGGRSRSRSRPGGAAGDQRKKTSATVEAYRPAAGPNCSQCGRSFRPERLHSHMKSCRALKGQGKSMASGKPQQRAGSHRSMPSEEPASLFLLSH